MTRDRGRLRVVGFDADEAAAGTDDDAPEQSGSLQGESTDRARPSGSRWRRIARRLRRDRLALGALAVLAATSLLSLLAEPIVVAGVPVQPFSLAPYDPTASLSLRPGTDVGPYAPPSLAHPMGTDGASRDVLSRVLVGGRYTVSIAVVVVALTATVGLAYGAVSGYVGGRVDAVLMRVVDVVLAFPGLLVALVVAALLGQGYWQLVVAFSLFGWAGYARIVRGEVLSVREREYVLAARAVGASDRRILVRHVVPNAVAPLVVQATLSVGTVVVGTAALGFLGLGFPPGTPEWGTMLQGTRETLIGGPSGAIPWWATAFPGGAIFLFVLAVNLVGDALNDALAARQVTDTPAERAREGDT